MEAGLRAAFGSIHEHFASRTREWRLIGFLQDQMDIPAEKKRSMQVLPVDKRWVLLTQSLGTGLLVCSTNPELGALLSY